MGDRANIEIREQGGNKLYLYTHWKGYCWPQKLQSAMKFAKSRWDDESYLHRCIVTEMCKDAKGETGYGLSTWLGDGEDSVTVLDTPNQKVILKDGTEFSFAEFIEANLSGDSD